MFLKKIVKLMKCISYTRTFCGFRYSGILVENGWWQSYKQKLPVDKNNDPLPWVTYSFIDFIQTRLTGKMDIFEYGSGNSTLWYAQKVNSVTSIEHDRNWFEKIKNNMPNNVNIFYEKLEYAGNYCKFSSTLDKKFDVIIVDGRDRVNCAKNAINDIKMGGVIVLDDSERTQYSEGIEFLMNNGFKKIDFWGIAPGIFFNKCTTIFYKNKNCIGI